MRTEDEVLEELKKVTVSADTKALEEVMLQKQISELREKLSALKSDRILLTRRKTELVKEKDSIARQKALQAEQERIDREFRFLVEEAEEIIKEAPWAEDIFDWQKEGAVKLANARLYGNDGARALLADTRGMGKTLSAIAWRRLVKADKTLVLAKKTLIKEFIKEVSIREPDIPIIPLIGPNPMQRKTITDVMKSQRGFIMFSNIEMWRRNTDSAVADLLKVGFDTIILDEAHHLKTFDSNTTKGFIKLAEATPNLLELTGSPIQNRPQELFALLHILYPMAFPDEGAYIRDYCYQVSQNRWKFKPGGLDSLVSTMSKFFVARTPEDVGRKLPPPKAIRYDLDMETYPEQKNAYRMMADRALAALKSGRVLNMTSILAVMTRQAQMVAWPAGIIFNVKDEDGEIVERLQFDVHQSAKLDWAEDLIKELVGEGFRVILFSRFKAPIEELQRRLEEEFPVALVTGDTTNNSDKTDDFDLKLGRDHYKVLLATYGTIGEAVNLNAATHAILFDRFWKPSADDQAVGRIDRLNSVEQATVHIPIVENSIDVYMDKLIEFKRDLQGDFKTAAEVQEGLIENLEASLW